jgi:tetratricopeptide (TPR) repeat protein
MHATGWSRGLEVTGGGSGVVSHAGLVLLRQLADRAGLTAGLSAALPSPLDGQYEEALAITENHDTLARKSGLVVIPATAAYLLAKLGRSTEAAAAVEESLARLPRVHPAKRPHYRLAQAFLELGRREDALTHASDAYRLAWADGPPNGLFWDLRNARELLEAMGEQVPDLPTIDAAGVRIPLESEIHALIAELAAKRREQSPGMHRGS